MRILTSIILILFTLTIQGYSQENRNNIQNKTEEYTICAGESIQINPTEINCINPERIKWSPKRNLDNPNTLNPIATPSTTTTYSLSYRCGRKKYFYKVTIKVNSPNITAIPAIDRICKGESVQLLASGGNTYVWSPTNGLNNPSISNPIASPENSTNYIVKGYDINGCYNEASVRIIVKPSPVVTVWANDSTICTGESVQLEASGGISYSWSPTIGLNNPNIFNPIASPNETTIYTVFVKGKGNCISSDQVTIKVNDLPEANAAEAVGRLPGVSLERSGGEGNKVIIRGMASKYTMVQIDGVNMTATGQDDRSTDLSMISPYMLEGIELTKSAKNRIKKWWGIQLKKLGIEPNKEDNQEE